MNLSEFVLIRKLFLFFLYPANPKRDLKVTPTTLHQRLILKVDDYERKASTREISDRGLVVNNQGKLMKHDPNVDDSRGQYGSLDKSKFTVHTQ